MTDKNVTSQQLVGFRLKHFDEIFFWIRTKEFIMISGSYNNAAVIAHFYSVDQDCDILSNWLSRYAIIV
jgi:hypothetical protein